ncbi:sugar kinase [Agromyces sp. SYSU T00266]|uniref:sugar kinase n=1 Tax=Agromyces zhanjiangensis TaxID=3158562 RepID=UPI003398E1EB
MPELLAVGESMLAFTSIDGAFGTSAGFAASAAGGESNVAVHVAAHGRTAAWASRLGDDPAGRRILAEVSGRGVDTSLVVMDPAHRTGIMLKDPSRQGSAVHYYRDDSAASRMDAAFAAGLPLDDVRLVHVTGVTPALSASCRSAVETLMTRCRRQGVRVSFDVNHRPRLWRDDDAPEALVRFASRADVCFVGRDEAETLWGTTSAEDVREFLPEPEWLVVKDGAIGATAFSRVDGTRFEAAPRVEVVEPVGAGDAFAGGFLAGLLAGVPLRERLRMGHAAAARSLSSLHDLPDLTGAIR